MFGRLIAPSVRNVLASGKSGVAARSGVRRAHYGGQDGVMTTMNDLPVPSGSWDTYYKAQQSKYNMHLAFGVVFTAVTLVVAKASGLVNLHSTVPAYPKDD